jgi:hypothetical protein
MKKLKLFTTLIIAAIIVTIGFVISGIVNATDKQKIIVTWLETNDTKTNDTSMISISGADFWKIFVPLLEQSINGTTSSSE